MIKKTIKFTDFNGNEMEESYYFHLSNAELAEMEIVDGGKEGLARYLQVISEANDGPAMLAIFKKILFKSYGKRLPDGSRFVKSKELSEAFEQSPAYSELFMELISDVDKTAEFINGVASGVIARDKPELTREELEAKLADLKAKQAE